MASKSDQVLMRVSFDSDQLGGALVWAAVDETTHRNALKSQGEFAGSLHFNQGDSVALEIIGFGMAQTFLGFDIVDVSVVTVPHTTRERQSAPSPFGGNSAVMHIEKWQAPTQMSEGSGRVAYSRLSDSPLPVIVKTGRWDLTIVLSVALNFAGAPLPTYRVFIIDPESEVGTGADPFL
jgi:hypothetical protein